MVDLGFTAREYALLIPILTACLVILIVTITFMVKKLKPKKITKDGVTFEEDSPVSPHKQCGHGRDWVQILAEHERMLAEFYEKRFKIGQRQERHLKAEAAKIRGIAQSAFLKLLKQTLNKQDKILEHPDYKEYVRALKDTIDIIIPIMLEDFDDDDIEAVSDEAFHTYADKRATVILQHVSDTLDDCYMGTLISRELIFTENKHSIKSEIKHQIEDTYWQARKIAKDTILETEALRKEWHKKLSTII